MSERPMVERGRVAAPRCKCTLNFITGQDTEELLSLVLLSIDSEINKKTLMFYSLRFDKEGRAFRAH